MGNLIETHFARMGARARVREPEEPPWRPRRLPDRSTPAVRLNVLRDARGEYFDLQADSRRVELEVLDVQPRERHLLLLSRELATGQKEKFLCGHDERAWFVAAVPGQSASNVKTAFEALKPLEVRHEQARKAVPGSHRRRRRTRAYVRQGEWFFVPQPNVSASEAEIHRHEPLRRGGSKAHIAEYCFRSGGQRVYVSSRYPNGVLEDTYRRIIHRNPQARRWNWRVMIRDAGVYVRGRIRHPDHKTIVLGIWHRVFANTESEAPSMRHVAFLD